MKYLLIILVVVYSNFADAQIPAYFENDQEWQLRHAFVSPPINATCSTFYYRARYVNGDTTINLRQYKVLGERGLTVHNPLMTNGCAGFGVNGYYDHPSELYFRQAEDSVYQYVNGQDQLVISYNVGVGDAFSITNTVTTPRVVVKIDTVVFNGQNYRKFYIDTVNNFYLIEGVCHYSSGISDMFEYWNFVQATSPEGYGYAYFYNIECYSHNGITSWVSPTYSGQCDYLQNVGTETTEISQIKELIKIVDLMGREMEESTNVLLLYIYSDGSIEKKFTVE